MPSGPNPGRTTANNVQFDYQRTPGSEVDNWFSESYTPQLVNASFYARVNWAQAEQFRLDMIGKHVRVGATIQRQNPEPWPFNVTPGPQLYCVGCESVANIGEMTYDASSNNAPQFDTVIYKCTFAAFLYDIKSDSDAAASVYPPGEMSRYVERRSEQIGQSLSTFGQFEYGSPNAWPTPNLPINTPPAIHVPYRKLKYIWHYVPGPIDALISRADDYYGTLNAADFDSKVVGKVPYAYAAETLMYLGMSYDRIPSTPYGNELWTITHNFAFFKFGWNKVYRPNYGTGASAWDTARNRATGGAPYDLRNFPNLFTL